MIIASNSTMVGENFEIYLSQIAKNALKLTTIYGENFEIYLFQIATNALKLSTMIGEIFENLDLEIPKNAMKSHEQFIFDDSIPSNSTMVGENFEI